MAILSNNYETILLKCFSKWKGIEVKIKDDWNVDGDQFYRKVCWLRTKHKP